MSALQKLIERQANGEKLTSLEFAVFWCTDRVCAENAAKELAAKDALIEELSHIGAHAWELADHHTRSYAKAPLLSDQQVKKFYEGMREEAFFFKRLLEKFSKYIKAAQ